MNSDLVLFVFASWEERFRLGVSELLEQNSSGQILMFYFDGYADRTEQNRTELGKVSSERGCELISCELSDESAAENWGRISDAVRPFLGSNRVIVDISTMPRDIIWHILWHLDSANSEAEFTYVKPMNYGSWLSRDPQRPRLVYKVSGISHFGKRTALVVVAGYDSERVQQLIRVFQPERAVIALQADHSDPQNCDRMNDYQLIFQGEDHIELVSIDAFSSDHGESILSSAVEELKDQYNIVMSSLGPKLTAISLYRVNRRFPFVALAYAPSKEFNADYSHGVGERIGGELFENGGD